MTKASPKRIPFKIPYGLIVVGCGVAYLAMTGVLAQHRDLAIFGIGGALALTISRSATQRFRALSRVAFVMAMLFGAALPLLAFTSPEQGMRMPPSGAQTQAVAGFLEQTSRAALNRPLTRREETAVTAEMQPVGPNAVEAFNARFAERWRRDIAAKRIFQLTAADWAFWRDLCQIAVTYDISDRDVAPTLRRYIGAFLSNRMRFRLDPDTVASVRRNAAMSRFRANLHSCGHLFDFPA